MAVDSHVAASALGFVEGLNQAKQERKFSEYAAVIEFIDGLKARGVQRFEGMGISLTFGYYDGIPSGPAVRAETNGVDIGDGIKVDPDLFGHER